MSISNQTHIPFTKFWNLLIVVIFIFHLLFIISFVQMKSNFKENFAKWDRHIAQYGCSPGNLKCDLIRNQYIVKADSLMSMIRATITPKDTITSADEINALRLKALEAMSTYVAEYNKINYVDFITDMRLEADFTPNECTRSGFGVDSEELTEFFENTMAEDICERLTTLQR